MKALSIMPSLVAAMITSLVAEERTILTPPSNLNPWLGEAVPVTIGAQVAGRFSGPVSFELPDLPGVIVFKPDPRPVLSSETIDGIEHTIQSHQFMIFCQRPGKVTIDGITVNCASQLPGSSETTEHQLKVEPFELKARQQADAPSDQPVITSSSFKVTESWDPEPSEAKPGDAFRRTVNVSAENLPAMLLPTLPKPESPGLAVYTDPPQLDDRNERGDFKASRRDSAVYVCEEAGTLTLPGFSYRCWNPDSEEWITHSFPETTLSVSGAAASPPDEERPVRWGWLLAVSLSLLAGIGVAIRLRPHHDSPESDAFHTAMDACRHGDPARAVSSFHRWASFRTDLEVDPETKTVLRDAEEAIVNPEGDWNGTPLAKRIKALRKTGTRALKKEEPSLPPLNPPVS